MAPLSFSLILLRLGTGGFICGWTGVVGLLDCFRIPFGPLVSSFMDGSVVPVLLVDFSLGLSEPLVNLFCRVRLTLALSNSFDCLSEGSLLSFDSCRISCLGLGVELGDELLSSVLDVCCGFFVTELRSLFALRKLPLLLFVAWFTELTFSAISTACLSFDISCRCDWIMFSLSCSSWLSLNCSLDRLPWRNSNWCQTWDSFKSASRRIWNPKTWFKSEITPYNPTLTTSISFSLSLSAIARIRSRDLFDFNLSCSL